jgi:hypothetical protein
VICGRKTDTSREKCRMVATIGSWKKEIREEKSVKLDVRARQG